MSCFRVMGLSVPGAAVLFTRGRGAPLLIRGVLGGVLGSVTLTVSRALSVSVRSRGAGADGCRTGWGAVDARASLWR